MLRLLLLLLLWLLLMMMVMLLLLLRLLPTLALLLLMLTTMRIATSITWFVNCGQWWARLGKVDVVATQCYAHGDEKAIHLLRQWTSWMQSNSLIRLGDCAEQRRARVQPKLPLDSLYFRRHARRHLCFLLPGVSTAAVGRLQTPESEEGC